MTEVELLKAQVESLEKLVKIKDVTISELEKQVASKPATSIQYVYYWYPYYPYNYAIPSQWQQYPYQPYYGGAGGGISIPNQGIAGQGGYGGTGGGIGGTSSGVVTFTGGAQGSGGSAIQTTGYMQTLDFPKPSFGSSN